MPGLAAKDVIDVQLTVTDLGALIRTPLEEAGFLCYIYVARDHAPPGMNVAAEGLEKRYFQGALPAVHLHVRAEGRFNQRYPLLCRDYLHTHPLAMRAYEEISFPHDTEAYYATKDPVFEVLMAGANEWAKRTARQPPESDTQV